MTNFVKQRYEYFVDLATTTEGCQVIQVTAGGAMPQIRLSPFFTAFKYYKLGKVKVRFVPASTLPVDPTGLSYEAGEAGVDPRDQFNPGLVRITNGEDISHYIQGLTGTEAERAYYSTLLDNRWFKFQLQSGFKRQAVPLYWNIGTTHQTECPTVAVGAGFSTANESQSMPYFPVTYELGDDTGTPSTGVTQPVTQQIYYKSASASSPGSSDMYNDLAFQDVMVQTSRERLGWLPTDMKGHGPNPIGGLGPVPEIDLLTIVLPQAYKTRYYYRVYISEEVMFKDAVVVNPIVSTYGFTGGNTGAIDRFVYPGKIGTTPFANTNNANIQYWNPINGSRDDPMESVNNALEVLA